MEQTVLPSGRGSDHAEHLQDLLRLLATPSALTLSDGSGGAELPDHLRRLLHAAVSNLADGTAVTITPHRTQLTTQEAADILGISRPTLIRLLTAGEIASTRPGRHRRIQLADVLAYQERIRDQRRSALIELSAAAEPPTAPDGFVRTR
ncbi:putative antitoxin VapB50 [Gordonia spumicola]|uniref:Putative antitoxin VapB50 n=2 Tax=Gordonia spumicola TaxID=589161 RepID=A0A7I9V5I6_9ACTN|nr:putative antitoxin VapB50 [Gordonia spumicola]